MRRTGVVLAIAALLGTGAAQPVLAQPADRSPAGEHAQQRLDWQPCSPEPQPGLPDGAERMLCATLTAPLDWNDPRPGEDITFAVSKLPAPDGAGRALFTNPGGPGGPGLEMPLAMLAQDRQRVLDEFDIYGIDVRGTGARATSPADRRTRTARWTPRTAARPASARAWRRRAATPPIARSTAVIWGGTSTPSRPCTTSTCSGTWSSAKP